MKISIYYALVHVVEPSQRDQIRFIPHLLFVYNKLQSKLGIYNLLIKVKVNISINIL